MPSKQYFSYIRVSTQRQGRSGTSLIEQQAAIENYAGVWKLPIVKRFEERETAAKQGRPVFLEMLKQLQKRKANGVIIHKIDRSARNLIDWGKLLALADSGLEIHFASESLDLNSRGGRLSADIQAVVATDYIRNLRDETIKGIYGRLRQGYYPFPAALGYADNGAGKPKTPDPIKGPLVREAFSLYSTGNWGLEALADHMNSRGLSNRNNGTLTASTLSTIFHNPFYQGQLKIKKNGQTFMGKHAPLVTKELFDKVQSVLQGKNIIKRNGHFFLFRRLVKCAGCQRSFIPERQKGHVYYRCQTRGCRRGTLREEVLEKQLTAFLTKLKFTDTEYELLKHEIAKECDRSEVEAELQQKELHLKLDKSKKRSSRLADGFMDGILDNQTYAQKKEELELEEREINLRLMRLSKDPNAMQEDILTSLELANSAYLSYKTANDTEKHDLVRTLVSNFTIEGEKVLLEPNLPFSIVADRNNLESGGPHRDKPRTISFLLSEVLKFFGESGEAHEVESNSDMGLET